MLSNTGHVPVVALSPRYSKTEVRMVTPLVKTRDTGPAVEEDYAEGSEVRMGHHRFVCINSLGRGSYGEVWRAKVLSGEEELNEVALKDVLCQSQGELQQAIFEVQVLLALERAAAQRAELRVPRCIAYKVAPSVQGWRVRTAMTVAPGESLDCFLRRPAPKGSLPQLRRALILVARLLRDIGPSLQLLEPIAWHRDVNSHNILVDGVDAPESQLAEQSSFWLIDFGLAVDSQSWVSHKWRTEYIGGDSRYWPPSSWIMHLVGPEGFDWCPDLCKQYQRRLDIHGLGITALELLCSMVMASVPASGEQQEEELKPWLPILQAWKAYREAVWRWWSVVYAVFSTGGDLSLVQQQLVEERLIERLLELLQHIRAALRGCAEQVEERKLLRMIADMLDEGKSFDLQEIQRLLGGAKIETAKPAPKRFHTTAHTRRVSASTPQQVKADAQARSREARLAVFPPDALVSRMQSLALELKEQRVQKAAQGLELRLQQMKRLVVGKARQRLQELVSMKANPSFEAP